jgi:hypothetical protein
MSIIGVVGLLGPVRRRRPLRYAATCPSCHQPGALTIRITIAGARPSCRVCPLHEVLAALASMRDERPALDLPADQP